MSWWDGLRSSIGVLDTGATMRTYQAQSARAAGTPASYADQYAILRAYYNSNALYDRLNRLQVDAGLWGPAYKPLRNPAQRITEFYSAHLWPGALPDALPIVTPQREQGEGATQATAQATRLIAAIHQTWTWSNWAAKKQVMARWLPMLGDVFLKVVAPQDTGRVYFELVDPAYVTAFETDPRGYLTWVRLDVPVAEPSAVEDAPAQRRTSTEVWSKADQVYRRWVHTQGTAASIPRLGTPEDEVPFAAMGIDFVPIVHVQFRDVGEPRGVGAFTLAIDKIDDVNLQATRLEQMLFRHAKNTWVLEGEGRDPAGRSQPPPDLAGRNGTSTASTGSVLVGSEDMYSLPSGWHLRSAVPDINYLAALAVLNAGMTELQQDCPEMAYWRITEQTADLSGRAIRFMLGPAIMRLLEVRGNAEDGLARADAMALTIGQAAKLPGFAALGDYHRGDLAHAFAPREVVPLSDLEAAEAAALLADAATKRLASGAWSIAGVLRAEGLSEAAIQTMATERATQDVIPTAAERIDG